MRRALEVLTLLADGRARSGEAIAAELGVSRAAVWNHVSALREIGIEILAASGEGYRLERAFEPLDAAAISAALSAQGCTAWTQVDASAVTDSTNERLLSKRAPDAHRCALFAEYQTAGRGRRGDRWLSPPGSGLCFSVGWRFEALPPTFSALSLAVGLGLVEELQLQGVADARLKWPNDIVRGNEKLAGILIEMRSEAGGPCLAIIGVGLNIRLSARARELIDRPSGDIESALSDFVARNSLAAALLARLALTLETFARDGFAPFYARWTANDALAGRAVTLESGERRVRGIARGADTHGALLIETAEGLERFLSGHLTAIE
jgi:BirA family biotin operon repressor/biotin-[acetyl-CoA-carboxylase] ligase